MNPPPPLRSSRAAFTTVELVVAIVLFSLATSGVLLMSTAMRGHRTAASSASERNAYATFQSQVALQGINPALVGNPLAGAINKAGTTGTTVSLGANTTLTIHRNQLAAFEIGAVSQPAGAQRNLGGSATVNAVDYSVAAAGMQATRGAGIGFAVQTTGTLAPTNAIPLAPPSFNIQGDLTVAPFPLDDIATLPSANPPGTTYRYTTDGSVPTASSPLWNNDPGWTAVSFPGEVTLAAFNTDPQYAPSVPVTAIYTIQLQVSFARADGRSANLYGFTLADLVSPTATGVVLTPNVPGFTILYTLDGSDPAVNGTPYAGPFDPAQAQFTPTVLLKVAAVSTDARITSAPVSGYTLTSITVPLGAPSFITDNSSPLSPGTPVVISAGSNGSPRTEVNNGNPTTSSSSATSFPLN